MQREAKRLLTYKIHLIRAGTAISGSWERYAGRTDAPLCDKGAQALEHLKSEYLYPRADIVFTSPLLRCMQTAELLYPDTYLQVHPDFTDMDLGEFTGKTPEELRGRPEYELWLRNSLEHTPPGGEAARDFAARIIRGLNSVFRRMSDERMQNAAIITHGGVIMTLLSAVCLPRLPLHEWTVENGCGYTVLMTPQLWMRDRICEAVRRIPEPADNSGAGYWGSPDDVLDTL